MDYHKTPFTQLHKQRTDMSGSPPREDWPASTALASKFSTNRIRRSSTATTFARFWKIEKVFYGLALRRVSSECRQESSQRSPHVMDYPMTAFSLFMKTARGTFGSQLQLGWVG